VIAYTAYIFKICQTVLKHKYDQSISQKNFEYFLSGFCYLKPLCSGGIDVDRDDHDNKTRIVSDLKMTARERYDPGSLLLLLYILLRYMVESFLDWSYSQGI
jgi:hypothetical protein